MIGPEAAAWRHRQGAAGVAQSIELSGNAEIADVVNCYRYILGREMNSEEMHYLSASKSTFEAMDINLLRRSFFQSPEFHARYLETVFENLVPRSTVVRYRTNRGFEMYLDLRQLHMSFGVLNELYEQHEVDLMRRLVHNNATFFDIGSNCGYYSLSVASNPEFRGQVVAFEPLEPLHALFERSIAANRLESRIKVFPLALADKPGTIAITDAEHSINAGATMLAFDGLPAERTSRSVRVETLDRVAGNLRPDVMKIDIQGAEMLFFHGAEATIAANRPTLFFEIAPELLALLSKAAPGDLQRWLVPRGYKLWKLEEANLRPIRADEDLGSLVGHGEIIDVLAVHRLREGEIGGRLGGLP